VADKEQIIAAHQSGLAIFDVALALRCCPKFARRVVKEAGITRDSRRRNQTREEVAKLAIKAGA
jgi:hypothetical protein